MHHHANGRVDWLISGHQSVYPSRKVFSILSGKYKRIKSGLHISRKDRISTCWQTCILNCPDKAWSHIVVMITSIDLSQEMFAISMLTALKFSLKHRRKHVLQWLRLYGDQALRLSIAQKLTNRNSHWHGEVQFSWPEDNELPTLSKHCLFLTCSHRDNLFFRSM